MFPFISLLLFPRYNFFSWLPNSGMRVHVLDRRSNAVSSYQVPKDKLVSLVCFLHGLLHRRVIDKLVGIFYA